MFKRRYILILFLIIIIASISHVGAAETNDASNVTSQTPADEMEVCDDAAADDGELSLSEETDDLQASNVKTFSDLASEIANSKDGTVELEGNYVYNPEKDQAYKYGIDIEKNLWIKGKSNIIHGNNKVNIFTISKGVSVEIDNVTFTGANIDEADCAGGVIFNEGVLGLQWCNFINNNVVDYGAAIYNYGNAYILYCGFINNNANYGAAIYNDKGISLRYCLFDKNNASYGGAIYNGDEAEMNISDTSFTNNTASNWGGAIFNDGELNTYTVSISNCTAYYGGAIYNNFTGKARIMLTSFEKNNAYIGGAIVNRNELYVSKEAYFQSNKATRLAGAIYTDYYAKIYDSSFYYNTGDVAGSAIFNEHDGVAYVDNCTFFWNIKADEKYGGIYECIVSNSDISLTKTYGGVINDCTLTAATSSSINSTGFEIKLKSLKINSNSIVMEVNVFSNPGKEIISGVGVYLRLDDTNTYFFRISKNGTATFSLKNFKYTTYRYTLMIDHDRISANQISGTFKIGVDPVITASNLKVVYSANPYYSIKVYGRDGKVAGGQTVVVKLNGKAFQTLKTDANGVAKFRVTQNPGTYKLTVTSLGTTVTRTLTVNHVVTLKAVTVKRSAKKLVLTATLSRVNGKYLSSKIVTFKFNGKTFRAKTNARGIAQVTIKSNVLKTLKAGRAVTYQATYLKDTVKRSGKVYK